MYLVPGVKEMIRPCPPSSSIFSAGTSLQYSDAASGSSAIFRSLLSMPAYNWKKPNDIGRSMTWLTKSKYRVGSDQCIYLRGCEMIYDTRFFFLFIGWQLWNFVFSFLFFSWIPAHFEIGSSLKAINKLPVINFKGKIFALQRALRFFSE